MFTFHARKDHEFATDVTVVAESLPDDSAIIMAVARCGVHDTFNRKLGRTIATGRLNKFKLNMNAPKAGVFVCSVPIHLEMSMEKFFISRARELAKQVADDKEFRGHRYQGKNK